MPDQTLNKLTAKQVEAAKPSDKLTTLADGGGLVLQVTPQGSKRWRFRYRFQGSANMLSFGVYPDTSLALARTKREHAKADLAAGVDPSAKRAEEKESHSQTFQTVAEEFLDQHDAAEDTTQDMRRRLEMFVFPKVGSRPIREVTSQHLLRCLKPLETSGKLETAKRTRAACSQVFRFAVLHGKAELDVAEALKGAIKPPKAKAFSFQKGPIAIGKLMRSIDTYEGQPQTEAALKLAPMLMLRPGELRSLEWENVDLEQGLVTIPGERMKVKRDRNGNERHHLVPLSPQAVRILAELQAITGMGRFVFPGGRGPHRPLSNNALTVALRTMGYSKDDQHAHGFRHMASTELNEMGVKPDVIEAQLAHVDSSVRGTYNAAQYLPERAAMLRQWSDFLDAVRDADKAEQLEHARTAAMLGRNQPQSEGAAVRSLHDAV